jgi:2-polyprenyl-3-methyl-5-hydroxy-6-metoxy-1,4-benzoquinol methylase
MRKFLKEILSDPLTGKDLIEENQAGKDFLSSENKMYPILENVPVLLPGPQKSHTNSDLHSQFHSDFNYADHYNEDANHFNYFEEEQSRATKEEIRRLHQSIIKRVPKSAELILDVGCGNGWVAKYFLIKRKKVVSMDISMKNPIKVLKENHDENHVAVVADAYHLPFKKNSFDAIIASEILEHVYDPKFFLIKLIEALKPGGILIITTPYNEKIEYFLCVHCNKPTPKNAHLHSFNEENIANFIPQEFVNFKTDKFSNKYLVRLRLNLLMSLLPFGLWRFKDAVVNSIFKKPLRFLIELKKK